MPTHIGITHPGLIRPENQDCFGIREIGTAAHLYTVCDGIGGSAGGKQASSMALSAFSSFVEEHLSSLTAADWDNASLAQVKRVMRAAASHASRRVHTLSLSDTALRGMGSTLVSALLTPQRVYILHVGDSRLYTVSQNGIEKITRDHSYIQYLIDIGRITPEQAKELHIKNYITQAIGAYDHVDGDFRALDIVAADAPTYLLLCSDGLYSTVSESDMQSILMDEHALSEKAEQLIRAALAGGGSDNITALIAKL